MDFSFGASGQAEQGKDDQHDDDQADQVNEAVHCKAPF
jgi:hypothetical protein